METEKADRSANVGQRSSYAEVLRVELWRSAHVFMAVVRFVPNFRQILIWGAA